ncbi:MAG: HAD-IA family hydrolase [Gammaproteobacteria bacterium]|nr:HAD-IA family hydrolase [Gammaproteobacteria bacterium]NNF66656.1 HAD-IA family hydrolase [Gammaproteobacteria bacterium]
MKNITVISIDLDDTLWPVAPVIRRAEKQVRRWLARHFPKIDLSSEATHFTALRQEVLRLHPDRGHDFAFQRRVSFRMLMESGGYDVAMVDRAYEVFMQARNEVNVYADVMPGLQRLGERYSLIAVTNGNADLDYIGLAHYFDHQIRAADIGAAKPAAAIFDAAAAAAGVSAQQVLHIGDAPLEDVNGAQQAGMTAIWMNRFGRKWPEEYPQAAAEISSLEDLYPLLLATD